VALGIGALAMLAGVLVWLYIGSRSPAAPEPNAVGEPQQPTTPAPSAPPPTAPQPTAPLAPKPTLSKIAIPRGSVQRDDGSASGTFTQATLRALRDAAAPAIKRCIDESLARYPEQKDAKAFVNVVFTARAAAGQVSVAEAHAVINGFPDDALARCAEMNYTKLRIAAASDQRDGEGTVQSGYEVR
jgi:hypothetical protein